MRRERKRGNKGDRQTDRQTDSEGARERGREAGEEAEGGVERWKNLREESHLARASSKLSPADSSADFESTIEMNSFCLLCG